MQQPQVEAAAAEVKQKEEAVAAREAALAKREADTRTAEADAQQRLSRVEVQETELKAKQLDAKELQVQCCILCICMQAMLACFAMEAGLVWCAEAYAFAYEHCKPALPPSQ